MRPTNFDSLATNRGRRGALRVRMFALYLAAASCLFGGCRRGSPETSVRLPAQIIDSPTGPGSAEPDLYTTSDGKIYLSWIEPVGTGHALRFSVRADGGWSAPKVVATGDDWFINWADFPSVIATPGGALAAHWLRKSGAGTYDYDVAVGRSLDGGTSWSSGATPYKDKTKGEHGFVSMLPWSGNDVLVVWLDGRHLAAEGDGESEHSRSAMMLRMAIVDRNNQARGETSLDDRVCDCCQTSAALTTSGAVIAYRDRADGEIRDISIMRVLRDGRMTEPRPVGTDGWEINGCPVNGPSLAADGDRVAIVWFTAADDLARVNVAFSGDEGETFAPPIRIDDGEPMGRVGIALLQDGSAVVSWMEYVGDGADIRLRRVLPDGRPENSHTLARSSVDRASGFPAIASNGHEVLVAWTEVGDPSRVRAASLRLE